MREGAEDAGWRGELGESREGGYRQRRDVGPGSRLDESGPVGLLEVEARGAVAVRSPVAVMVIRDGEGGTEKDQKNGESELAHRGGRGETGVSRITARTGHGGGSYLHCGSPQRGSNRRSSGAPT